MENLNMKGKIDLKNENAICCLKNPGDGSSALHRVNGPQPAALGDARDGEGEGLHVAEFLPTGHGFSL